MTQTKHVDVCFYIEGVEHFVGHFDIPNPGEREITGGDIANMLHQVAWGFEAEDAKTEGVEDLGGNSATPKPRKVTTPIADLLYWEVAPGEFSNGVAIEQALANYHAGQVFTEEQIRKFYPGSLWEHY